MIARDALLSMQSNKLDGCIVCGSALVKSTSQPAYQKDRRWGKKGKKAIHLNRRCSFHACKKMKKGKGVKDLGEATAGES